jgi:HEPN domain-containing protein
MQDSKKSKDWFEKGNHDVIAARIVFKASGPTDTVGMLLHQAFEKYIKGYLLSRGWELRKIHDLRELIFRAQDYNQTFGRYLELARKLTAIYVEGRYPSGPPVDYPQEELAQLLA